MYFSEKISHFSGFRKHAWMRVNKIEFFVYLNWPGKPITRFCKKSGHINITTK